MLQCARNSYRIYSQTQIYWVRGPPLETWALQSLWRAGLDRVIHVALVKGSGRFNALLLTTISGVFRFEQRCFVLTSCVRTPRLHNAGKCSQSYRQHGTLCCSMPQCESSVSFHFHRYPALQERDTTVTWHSFIVISSSWGSLLIEDVCTMSPSNVEVLD